MAFAKQREEAAEEVARAAAAARSTQEMTAEELRARRQELTRVQADLAQSRAAALEG
jgi:hypothetical protein